MNLLHLFGLPPAASSYASDIDFGLRITFAAIIFVFFSWSVYLAYLVFRYRKKPGAQAEYEKSEGISKAILPGAVVLVLEMILIIFWEIPVWGKIKEDMPMGPDVIEINVLAQQFAWNIQYPGPDGKFGKRKEELVSFSNPIGLDYNDPAAKDDIVLANEIHLPLGKTALIHLMSMDVVHDFAVPEFRIKQDVVPGMDIPLWVKPTRLGTYDLACAQLCGFGHSLMVGHVIVQTPEDFAAWLKKNTPVSVAASSANNF